MIKTRRELQKALAECQKAYDVAGGFSFKEWLYDLLFPNYYYHFMRNLCHLEYCQNQGGCFVKIVVSLEVLAIAF